MTPRRRTLATLLLGGLATAGCQANAAEATVVTTRGERFLPATVTVPAGSTVRWSNDTGAEHTVTSANAAGDELPEQVAQPSEAPTYVELPSPGTDAFDSGVLTGGAGFSHTFEEPGTYLYACRIHADQDMTGVVVVEP